MLLKHYYYLLSAQDKVLACAEFVDLSINIVNLDTAQSTNCQLLKSNLKWNVFKMLILQIYLFMFNYVQQFIFK